MPKAPICRAAAGAVIPAGLAGGIMDRPERVAWWNIRFSSPLTTPTGRSTG
jgi:hypothetical protein